MVRNYLNLGHNALINRHISVAIITTVEFLQFADDRVDLLFGGQGSDSSYPPLKGLLVQVLPKVRYRLSVDPLQILKLERPQRLVVLVVHVNADLLQLLESAQY